VITPDRLYLSFENVFFELNRVNGVQPSEPMQKQNPFFYAGHSYVIKNAWKTQSICSQFITHVIDELIHPSFFLENLTDLFEAKTIINLLKHNICIIVLHKRVYAVRKYQNDQWVGMEVISKKHIGDPVTLDQNGNILETYKRTKEQQTRINRRRRFDTKLIAAFTQ